MAKDIHISEDEQLVRIKNWWKNNATGVIIGVALGVTLIVGYNWWQKYQASQAAKASQVFSELVLAVEVDDVETATALSTNLRQDFADLDYADKGVILAAVVQLKAAKVEAAKDGLSWVLENSKFAENKQFAAVKLARQLYREQAYDKALDVLDIEDKGGFASQINEVIGDIEFSRKDLKAANAAYNMALDQLPESSTYRETLQLKLNNSAS